MKTIVRTAALLSLLVAVSCGTRDSGSSAGTHPPTSTLTGSLDASGNPLSCNLSDMRGWVDTNMRDYYLFYDQVPVVNLPEYGDLNTLVQDLRVKPNDRFSYITDSAQANAHFEQGRIFGFGHQIAVTNPGEVRFTVIYAASPFAIAGVERGDYLIAINGASPFTASDQDIEDFFGVSGVSATQSYTIRKSQGQEINFTASSTTFDVDTVMVSDVLNNGGVDIGYLAFDSFLETSRTELDTVFADFQQQGINELILDLRYNLGGRVDVAKKMASLIVGNGGFDQVFTTFALNDKYAQYNESIKFTSETNALDLDRLIVLTTDSSCSASELVINGLRPFIEVVVIGGATCGKPYGSAAREACGKQMNALQFEFVNASNSGGYYEGIPADCAATDDIDNALGNPAEGMLRAGLDFVTSGSCQLNANRSRTPTPRAWRLGAPSLNQLNGPFFTQ